jgi:integrase
MYKRNGIWWTDISFKGRRIRQSTCTENKEQAKEFEARLKARLWENTFSTPSYTWDEAVVKYLKTIQKSPKEIEGDKTKLRFWTETFRGVKLSSITRQSIENVINGMSQGPTTKNRYLAVLSTLLNLAKQWGWVQSVPSLPKKKEPPGRVRFLSPDEVTRLIAALPEKWRDPFELALNTGLRASNVTRLKWSQVNLENRTIAIFATAMKGKQSLGIPLTDDAITILKRNTGGEYVFDVPQHMSSKIWKKALAEAKIENFKWHDIRHTWASWLAMRGVPLNVIMQLGGWRSYDMVLRYAHLSSEYLQKYVTNLPRNP